MSEYVVTDTELTAVADAIREKGGTSADLEWNADFISAIQAISGGGGGSKNILKGTVAPTALDGVDGDIYIKYFNKIPNAYTPIEYVQSDGSGQYINTGIIPDENTEVEAEVEFDNLTSTWRTIFGSYLANVNTAFMVGVHSGQYTIQLGTNNYSDVNATIATNQFYNFVYKDGDLYVDDTFITSVRKVVLSSSYALYLFGVNINNSLGANQLIGKIKKFVVKQDGEIAQYLVPVSRNSDSAIGFYDLVTDTFFGNAGSSSFTGGNTTTYDKYEIEATYLKVNGSWQSLIGQDIDDVNTQGGGTSDIDTSLLPNSDATKILMSQDDSIASVDHWGRLSLYNGNLQNSFPFTVNQDGALQFNTSTFGTFQLLQPNRDVTIYTLFKIETVVSGDIGILGISYSLSGNNAPLFFSRNGVVCFSVWQDATVTEISISDYHVLAISLNQSTKKARFFIDDSFIAEKTFGNSGNQVIINSFGLAGTSANNCAFKYIGIVNECESDATVITNMQHLMQEFNIGE